MKPEFRKTNARQLVLVVQGLRKPALGEVFEIEVPPYRERIEVECLDVRGYYALCELTEDGSLPEDGMRSRVISACKVRPPDMPHGERIFAHQTIEEVIEIVAAERRYDDYIDSQDTMSDDDWRMDARVDEGPHWSERDGDFT